MSLVFPVSLETGNVLPARLRRSDGWLRHPRRAARTPVSDFGRTPDVRIKRQSACSFRMLCEPGLRDTLLRPRQPRLGDELLELVTVDPGEVRNPHENRRVSVEVWRREVDAAVVGKQKSLASRSATGNMSTSESRSPVSGSIASGRRPR